MKFIVTVHTVLQTKNDVTFNDELIATAYAGNIGSHEVYVAKFKRKEKMETSAQIEITESIEAILAKKIFDHIELEKIQQYQIIFNECRMAQGVLEDNTVIRDILKCSDHLDEKVFFTQLYTLLLAK